MGIKMCVCMCVCMCECVHKCVCIHAHVCTGISMRVCIITLPSYVYMYFTMYDFDWFIDDLSSVEQDEPSLGKTVASGVSSTKFINPRRMHEGYGSRSMRE